MKVLAIIVMAMALVIAIVPQFTNCEYGAETNAMPAMDDSAMPAMDDSMSTDGATAKPTPKMKCLWSARSSIAIGSLLFVAGAMLFFVKGVEARRVVAGMTGLLGIMTILLPTVIIGACRNDEMVCQTTMQPTLIAAGSICIAASLAALVITEVGHRRAIPPAAA